MKARSIAATCVGAALGGPHLEPLRCGCGSRAAIVAAKLGPLACSRAFELEEKFCVTVTVIVSVCWIAAVAVIVSVSVIAAV